MNPDSGRCVSMDGKVGRMLTLLGKNQLNNNKNSVVNTKKTFIKGFEKECNKPPSLGGKTAAEMKYLAIRQGYYEKGMSKKAICKRFAQNSFNRFNNQGLFDN